MELSKHGISNLYLTYKELKHHKKDSFAEAIGNLYLTYKELKPEHPDELLAEAIAFISYL